MCRRQGAGQRAAVTATCWRNCRRETTRICDGALCLLQPSVSLSSFMNAVWSAWVIYSRNELWRRTEENRARISQNLGRGRTLFMVGLETSVDTYQMCLQVFVKPAAIIRNLGRSCCVLSTRLASVCGSGPSLTDCLMFCWCNRTYLICLMSLVGGTEDETRFWKSGIHVTVILKWFVRM